MHMYRRTASKTDINYIVVRDPEGGGADQDHHSLECDAIIGPPVKHHSIGDVLAGRWWTLRILAQTLSLRKYHD